MINLEGKNILVSGASSGIGRKCAIDCNKLGAQVHLLGRDSDSLEEVFASLSGGHNSYHVLDMHDTDRFPELVNSIVEKHGKLTGFIHSAGYQITAPLKAMSGSQYHDILLVNTVSAFEMSRLITYKKNHQARELSIIFIAGGISVMGVPALTAYGASKAALVGGAKAMAIELATKGIRVNCVSPGYVTDTKMLGDMDALLSDQEYANLSKGFPLGLGKTNDISAMCAYLSSDLARWITGQNYLVDGGATAR